MRSLFSGVSGLKGHQTRMDVIGNNIANVNTTGFKSSRATFADAISQTTSGASSPTGNLGGTNPKQIGLGSNVSSIDLIFTDGSVQSTGKNTDLCLSGSGLFVVKQGIQTYYTRNGAFEFDAEGNYVMPGSGLFVQGWMGENGTVNTSGAVTNINVPSGKSMAAQVTGLVTYANNLNSDMLLITGVTGGTTIDGRQVATASSAVTLTFSDGTTQTVTSGSYVSGHGMPITTTATIYDSLGASHSVPILLEIINKTPGAGNVWTAAVAPTEKTTSTGTTVYDTTIHCDDGTIIKPTLGTTTIVFDTVGAYVPYDEKTDSGSKIGSLSLEYEAPPTGSGVKTPQSVALSFSDVTQYAGSNTVNASADGNAAGTLSSLSIDASGTITGTYTNGIKQAEAQIAIAQFNNASGLTKTGNSLYQESNNSGTPNVKTAGDLGVTITGSALEMSNVDIANEFSDMIVTQRGFQSNSKIITVSDELLETVINMKR